MDAGPFAQMTFCYPWREYQAAVLADLSTHIDDRKLHVGAAPGVGKTVLRLEVMRRIGKQWVDRLVDLFLPTGTHSPTGYLQI